MIKRIIIIGVLAFILLGATAVAAYDTYQGESTLDLPDASFLTAGQGNGQGQGQGQGQGNGQGQGASQGQGQGAGPGQGHGSNAQGQGGNGAGQGQQPQQQDHDWVTISGSVISTEQQGLLVDTVEQGELLLNLGRPGFADEQAVAFNAGDAVTIDGFESPEGMFVAGAIINETSGQTLHLRDPNGRPLWAGQGQGGGQGGQGQGGGQGGQGQGQWQ